MGAAGTPALPALQAALDDESQDVRYVARYAIAQLSSGNEAFWTAVDRARAKSSRPPAAGPPR
jgi:HEAT repeat protein